jgi:signal transduction histidine kinase
MTLKDVAQSLLTNLKKLQKNTIKLPVGPDREFAKLMDVSLEENLKEIDDKIMKILPNLIHEGIKMNNLNEIQFLIQSVNDSVESSIQDVVCSNIIELFFYCSLNC